MKKIHISVKIIFGLVAVLLCCSCSKIDAEDGYSTRFKETYVQNDEFDTISIYTDTQTGKEYMVFWTQDGASICSMTLDK